MDELPEVAEAAEPRVSLAVALLVGAFLAATSCGTRESAAVKPSQYATQVLADGAVGYWRLDEQQGQRAEDKTPFANHGIIRGGVMFRQTGATLADGDSAIFFNGRTGVITVESKDSLRMGNGALTLEAWIKPAAIQTGEAMIVCKGTSGVWTEYGLALMEGVPGYQSIAENYKVPGGKTVDVGVWTHLAVTVSKNSVLNFYINGVDAGSVTAITNHVITSSTQPLTIGGEAVQTNMFMGAIDDAAVYDHPLTAAQVAQHFAAAATKGSRP
jgi:hypothetical protein